MWSLAYIGVSIPTFQTWVFVRVVLLTLPTLTLTLLALAKLRSRIERAWVELIAGPGIALLIAAASLPALPFILYGEYHPRPVFGKMTEGEARLIVLWVALAAVTYGVSQAVRTSRSARRVLFLSLGLGAWASFLWVLDRSFNFVDRSLDIAELHWKIPVCLGLVLLGATFGAIRRVIGERTGLFPAVSLAAGVLVFLRPAEFPEDWPVSRVARIMAARLEPDGGLVLIAKVKSFLPPRHPWAEDMASNLLLRARPGLADSEGLRAVVRRPIGIFAPTLLSGTSPDARRAVLSFAPTWLEQSAGQVATGELVELADGRRSTLWRLSVLEQRRLVASGSAGWTLPNEVLGPGKAAFDRIPRWSGLSGRLASGSVASIPLPVPRGRALTVRAGPKSFAAFSWECSGESRIPEPCAFFIDAESGSLTTTRGRFEGEAIRGPFPKVQIAPDARAVVVMRAESFTRGSAVIGAYLFSVGGFAGRLGGCAYSGDDCLLTWCHDGTARLEDGNRVASLLGGLPDAPPWPTIPIRMPMGSHLREVGGRLVPEPDENRPRDPFPLFELAADVSSARLVEPVVTDVQYLDDSIVFVTGGLWSRDKGKSQEVVRYWPRSGRRVVLIRTSGAEN